MRRKSIGMCALYIAILSCVPQYLAAQPYTVSQEGIASWYGEDFNGRPTASGEIFNASRFTAAHPELPFGTFVRVTNKLNNKQVTVTVNDRGPFVAGRIIDLSRAAAEQLDMIAAGTVPVKIETLATNYAQPVQIPVPEQPPAPPPPTPAPPPAPVQEPPPVPPINITVYQPAPTQPQPPPPEPAAPYPQPQVYYYQPEPPAPPPPVYYQPPEPAPYPPTQPSYYYQPPQPPPPIPTYEALPPAPPQAYYQPEPPYAPPPQYYQPPQPPIPTYDVTPPQYYPPLPPPAQPPIPAYDTAPQPQIIPPPVMPVTSGARLIPTITPQPNSRYKLQIGSYKEPRNAVEAFDKLKSVGLNPTYEPNGIYYRVVLAGVRGNEVQSVAEKLQRAGFSEAVISEER